jgi:hypothetical protein
MSKVSKFNCLKVFFCCLLLNFSNLVLSEDKPRLSSAFYAKLSVSVVKILAPSNGKLYSGSGVVVGPGKVLTNCHVVRRSSRITVMKGALRYPVESQKVDIYKDLCLLDVPSLKLPAAEIRNPSEMSVGDFAYFYGYPGGADAFFTEGRVSGLHPLSNSVVLKTTAGFSSGGSGGGLFDFNGKLIGITTFYSAGHSGGYYALPIDWMLAVEKKSSEPISPLDGNTLWEMDFIKQPKFLRFARYAEDKNWISAMNLTNIWISEESGNFDSWLSHGQALLELGKDSESLISLNRALTIAPDDANVLYSLKKILLKQGGSKKLEEVSNKLKMIDPKEVSAGKCNMAC